ncbi:hypothetical protein P691DRAFT_737182 [Macrolepiota fuliginosa MF-IS2]|uniref:Uncharacterized protein n=1 Tax=Macrolepiota fuliginosa MF-IS2 TaxID=1400762 RepID=A0A9P6BZW6_9AGAR|nr:hypothetical protein P691DRAFT_737182 [Macrolepiota fuliginosa MF-IS2]
MEYLLLNKVPPVVPLAKISFVLMPWNRDPDVEPLPELLNTQQSKLTASRQLRVRKIALHVQEKLDRLTNNSSRAANSNANGTPGSTHSRNNSAKSHNNGARAETEYEILCGDTLLPLNMTLAAVRQYVWKQSAELVMHYRRRVVPVPVTGAHSHSHGHGHGYGHGHGHGSGHSGHGHSSGRGSR